MLVIGLTGGIASGKTTATQYLKSLNIPIIDADDINKALLQPKQPAYLQVLKCFPDIPINQDSTLDKRYMRQHILANNVKKKQLEALLHPLIKQQIIQQVEQCRNNNNTYCVVSAALLIEARLQSLVDVIWVTDCPESIQIERLSKRDNMSQVEAKKMLSYQLTRKQRLSFAQAIIPSTDYIEMKNAINTQLDNTARF